MCNKGITQFYLPPTHKPYLTLLPSRKASPVPTYTAWWQRHIGVRNLRFLVINTNLHPILHQWKLLQIIGQICAFQEFLDRVPGRDSNPRPLYRMSRHPTDSATTPPMCLDIKTWYVVYILVDILLHVRTTSSVWGKQVLLTYCTCDNYDMQSVNIALIDISLNVRCYMSYPVDLLLFTYAIILLYTVMKRIVMYIKCITMLINGYF